MISVYGGRKRKVQIYGRKSNTICSVNSSWGECKELVAIELSTERTASTTAAFVKAGSQKFVVVRDKLLSLERVAARHKTR